MVLTMMPMTSVKAQEVEPISSTVGTTVEEQNGTGDSIIDEDTVSREWTAEDMDALANGTMSLSDQVALMEYLSVMYGTNAIADGTTVDATEIPADTIGGTNNPFKIGNVTILQELAHLVSNGTTYGDDYSYAAAHYVMVADIDMGNLLWTAISGFTGSFDGGEYSISSSVVSTGIEGQVFGCGLFAAGTQNVTVAIVKISEGEPSGGAFVDGICEH